MDALKERAVHAGGCVDTGKSLIVHISLLQQIKSPYYIPTTERGLRDLGRG